MTASSTPPPAADRTPHPGIDGPDAEPVGPPRGLVVAVGTWAARHRRPVLALWLAVLVLVVVGRSVAGGVYSTTLTIPGSRAQQGLDVLRAHDPKGGGQSGQVVFVDPHGRLQTERPALEATRVDLSRLRHVLSVSDPLSSHTVSRDGGTAYATIDFDTNPQSLRGAYLSSVNAAAAAARHAGLQVSYGGALGQAATPKASDARSEAIGIVAAVIILLAGFGSVLAAALPLIGALIAVLTGVSLLGVLAAGISLSKDAPTLATMMGLGVGIDYALFLVTRHRQRLIEGDDPILAIRRTLAGSGRSVLIAATTVVVAMLALYASGISFIGKLGLAAVVTVAVSALAALTLAPALLALAGGRIDRLRIRTPVAEPTGEGTGLHRYAKLLARHPWRFATGGLAILAVLAIPMLSMRLGHVGPGSEPTSYSERQAYDAVSRGFGPGATGPLTIVARLPRDVTTQQRAALESSLPRALRATSGVASVTALRPSPDGALLVGRVIPTTGPSAGATQSLVARLQDHTLPSALAAEHATGYVSGTTAAAIDFQATVASRLALIVGVIAAAAFLLLLIAFRSPVLALTAAVLNLFSIGAAYGILVAAFQFGWASSLLGIPGTVPIESYVPMIVLAIVFGLSMDYEVFLVSRIREHWLQTGDNSASVAHGLNQTARVITAAALIMACVFFSFLLSTKVTIQMFALGLGFSVLIDATLIRMVIVPATMLILGGANWWTPRWLDRVLPRLEA